MPILDPTLTDAIEGHIEGAANNFGVATAGIVVSVKNVGGVTRTITVKPAVHKLVESEDDEDIDDVEEYPALQEVPVCWLVGRGVQVKGQLQPGDSVLLICMDRDISGWRRSGSESEPDDVRIHDWSQAVAIPGLVPDTSPFPEPSDAAALASAVDGFAATIAAIPPATGGDGGASAAGAANAIIAAFSDWLAPLFTCGSVRLKVDS